MATGIKTGGRAKGTPNRTTTETKELLQNIVSKELDNIVVLLEKLEPKERIDAIIKLLPYIVPKQQEIALESKATVNGIKVTIVNPNEDDN
jgi:23S rRNA C2498 (ribose-2'-O)-methylase RlmM